jgi:hypothetical protein
MVKNLLKTFTVCLLALTMSQSLFAQQSTPMESFIAREYKQHSFQPVSGIWNTDTEFPMAQAAPFVKTAAFFTLNSVNLNNFMTNRHQGIRLSVPDGKGGVYEIDLARFDFFSRGFKVQEVANGIATDYAYTPGLYYRGAVSGVEGSVAAFSFFNDEVYGVFSLPGVGNFSIVPNTLVTGIGNAHYILYNDADIIDFSKAPKCGSEVLEAVTRQDNTAQRNTYENCKDVEVFLQADYATYVSRSSSTTNVTNYITSIFNVLSTLYRNEGIYTSIKQLNVNTTTDIYATLTGSSISSSDFLDAFGNQTASNFNGADLAHLVSTSNSASLGGVAWLDQLCASPFYYTPFATYVGAYAFSNIQGNATISSFPTYVWNVEVMTHEMGHNLGSPHTHSCTAWTGGPIDWCAPTYNIAYIEGSCTTGPVPSSGTVMSYCHLLSTVGINFSNGFGPQPGTLLRSKVAAAACASNYIPDTAVSANNTVNIANRECTDATGFTYYWNDNNTADESDDRLSLKIKKNGNAIGDLDVIGFDVRSATLNNYTTNTGIQISLPSGLTGVQANNAAMRRYWSVTLPGGPTTLTTNAEVHFPFLQQDITAIDGSVPAVVNFSDLLFYKVSGTVDPNPANGLVGATTSNTNVYTYNATTPSLTQWTYSTSGNTKFAKFLVNSFSGGSGFGTSAVPLSLDFISFTGKEVNQNIVLQWVAENEKEIREYTLEKSVDGMSYNGMAIVAAKNGKSQTQTPTALQPRIGYNYYRLSYTSTSGEKLVAGTTKVLIAKDYTINIYPNPASNALNIHVSSKQPTVVNVKLTDLTGRLVYTASQNSTGLIRIDISQFTKGIYNLTLVMDGETVNEKITVE